MGQQFLEMESPSQAVVAIDHREDKAFDALLQGYGARTERKQLQVGDFICSARCVVERKTRSDFEASVMDGRLFSQLPNLLANYARVIVMVEGEESSGQLSTASLLGAYATIVTDFGATLFFTRNKERTAELVYAIAKHEQIAKKQPMRIYAKRKTFTLAQTQRSIVEMLPMVGPRLAKALLSHFGNVENIANASERELLEVEGMGKKRAKIIRNVIASGYQKEEDEERLL